MANFASAEFNPSRGIELPPGRVEQLWREAPWAFPGMCLRPIHRLYRA